MEEQKKEKKPRGPRKTALQQLEADRDRYAKQRMDALKRLNVAKAALVGLQSVYDAADAAFKAMDGAVRAQTECAESESMPDTTSSATPAPVARGRV